MRGNLSSAVAAAVRRLAATGRSSSLAAVALAALPVIGPAPAARAALRSHGGKAQVVLAGGCYWGVESVFDHVRGVASATSGYATPVAANAADPAPHAEAVRLVYDPSRISYHEILDVFFSVAHDPTQLDRQGPDVGTEYRSVVFVQSDSQRAVVQAYIDSLDASHVYGRLRVVTQIAPLGSFEAVGPDQQHYAAKHPNDPYIVTNDEPKLAALRQRFPRLYKG